MLKCSTSSPCCCFSGWLSHLWFVREFRFWEDWSSHDIRYLFAPDWSEPRLGLVVSCETSRAFFFFLREALKEAHFSLRPFHRPFSLTLSSLSVSHLISCSHTPCTSPHAAFLFVCLCVMHTNAWHYDMMTQCSLLNLSHRKKNHHLIQASKQNDMRAAVLCYGRDGSYSCCSLVFLVQAFQSIISALKY